MFAIRVRPIKVMLRLPHKLALLSLAMASPLIVVTALYWGAMRHDLDMVADERAGLALARTVWPYVADVSAAGDGPPGPADDAKFFAAAAAYPFASVDRRDIAAFAETLCVGEALACRAQRADARLRAASNLLWQINDTSRLSLDPQHLSLHAIFLAMNDLPEAATEARLFKSTQNPTDLWRKLGQILQSTTRLTDRIDRMKSHLPSDHPQAEAFYDAAQKMQATIYNFTVTARAAAETRGASAGFDETSAANLEAQKRELAAASDRLWRLSADVIDGELVARRADIAGSIGIGAVMVAAAALFAALLAGFISRSITHPLGQLRSAMRRIAEGDLNFEPPYRALGDEIGETARSVDFFRNAMIERDRLERDLAHERDALEERVAQRTEALEMASLSARQGELTLRHALETVRAGVYSIDLLASRYDCSPEFIAICGRAMAAGEFADEVWNAAHPDDHERIRQVVKTAREENRGFSVETRIIRPDGEIRWVLVTAMRMNPVLVAGLVMDITDRKNSEIALAEAQSRAEAASAAKSAFLAAMSHEIRTPLNGVLGMAAALSKTDLTMQQTEMVGVVNQSGALLLTLLNDVLDISKIEAGRLELESIPFNVKKCAESVVALYREAASAKGLLMAVAIDPRANATVAGDPTHVRQILQNFLSNAVKFTEQGHIEVRVTAEPHESRLRLHFEVEDSGAGIGKDHMARLFEKFAQADATITRRFGGSGLGLAISRDLARIMGGDIGAASQVGRGSTFWFEVDLPLAEASADETPAESESLFWDLRILAADDNATNRLVLRTLLDQAGLTADFVENGMTALEAANSRPYSLILMDIHMPVMDGMEAARAIRAGCGPNANTPIIALTADAMPKHVAACFAAGMNAHVAKPINPRELFAAMTEALAETEETVLARRA
jgi:PAS domain S-box-containing protein